MWKSLRRRGSKQPQDVLPADPMARDPHESVVANPKAKGVSFLDLPAEIRNSIYEYATLDTTITVGPQDTVKISPGLLLTSHQVRREYLPLMLSTAPLRVAVHGFDFRNLMRIVGSLYSTELKALRENRRLVIRLVLERYSRDEVMTLRRWLWHRASKADHLDWHYQIVQSHDETRWNTSNRNLTAVNLSSLERLHDKLNELMQWELRPIMAALEEESHRLGRILYASHQAVGSGGTRS